MGRGRASTQLFQDALAQVELADRLGIDYAWEVEHHFLEEYSHSSAPEVFLAAALPAHAAHPPRARHRADAAGLQPPGARRRAHRHARPRLQRPGGVGHRRVGLARRARGLRRSTPAERRAMWRETAEQVANMMAMDPYPGFDGQVLLDAGAQRRAQAGAEAAPAALGRVLEPRDHPPRRPARHRRAHLRVHRPRRGAHWVDDYYETFKRECVPIGHAVNPNIAMVTGLLVPSRRRGGRAGAAPTASASSSSRSAITTSSARTRRAAPTSGTSTRRCATSSAPGHAGRRHRLHRHARRAARVALRPSRTAGVDQTVFIQQGGKNRHEHICESLELFAAAVMPEFKEREAERAARKAEALAPYVEAAFARKRALAPLADARSRPTRPTASRSRRWISRRCRRPTGGACWPSGRMREIMEGR